jgi:hypothetical protein
MSVLPGVGIAPVDIANLQLLDSAADAMTATPAATQTNTTALTSRVNRFSTVASGAGTRLPPALPGMTVTVYNAGANALLIFPSSAAQGGITGGDQINALGANASYSETAGNKATFQCLTAGQWYASQGALS